MHEGGDASRASLRRAVSGKRGDRVTSLDAVGNGPRQALIVEDDREFLLYLSDLMSTLAGQWDVKGVTLGQDGINFARSVQGRLDLALVDLGLPDMDGLRVVSSLREHCPTTPILILTVIATEHKVMEALRAGANGYLLKDDGAMEVAAAVEQVIQGNHPISPQLAGYLIRAVSQRGPSVEALSDLSERETQLLRYIAAGHSYAEAAHAMGVTTSTAHSYSKTLFRKLGVKSKTQAALHARLGGLDPP